jgi:hypothetical protein
VKVLDGLAIEDMKDDKDFIKNDEIMNVILLDLVELSMKLMSKMAHGLPKMNEKVERKMKMV